MALATRCGEFFRSVGAGLFLQTRPPPSTVLPWQRQKKPPGRPAGSLGLAAPRGTPVGEEPRWLRLPSADAEGDEDLGSDRARRLARTGGWLVLGRDRVGQVGIVAQCMLSLMSLMSLMSLVSLVSLVSLARMVRVRSGPGHRPLRRRARSRQ